MIAYSRLLNKYYDADNSNVVYIANMVQCAKFLKNGASEDLVDILYENTRRDNSLVFVFKKTPLIKELYRKWQAHELD